MAEKPGPKPGPKWGEKSVSGIIVGRNNIIVPPEEVEDLAAIGCTDLDIARWFGIDDSTLRYNFTDYLIKGRENLKISLRRSMLKNACVNLNAAVQIFLAKNMLGMSDNGMTTDGSKVLPFTDNDDKPTPEQLADMQDEYQELNAAE
jgi:hypothetical protein